MSDEQDFKMPSPGPKHELLKAFEGTFKSEVKIWMGPGDPVVSTGTMVNTFQVDGLYLHQDYRGDKTEGPFPSFVGRGYWGFNTTSEEYEGFWIDNASTSMQLETGNVDDSGQVWEMHSEFIMPGSDTPMKKRSVITILDQDHHTMDSYITPPDSPEIKNMAIDYKRA